MVKRIRLYAALALIACTAVHAQVAPAPAAGDFYATMLRRGIVSFDAGRDVDAVRQLRIAAFGFVDSLDLYQTAETYLALAYARSGNTDRAHESARKVVAAQRQIPRYATLALPAAVRASFDALAIKLLTTAEVATLRTAASGTVVTPPQTASATPTTGRPAQTPPPAGTASPVPTTTPAAAKPVATTPAATTPTVTTPAATTPAATQTATAPRETAPASTAPATIPPATTQSAPATTKPVVPEPATSRPASANPAPASAGPSTTSPSTTPARETPREQPKSVTTEVPFGPAPPPQPPVVKPQPAPAVKAPAATATTTPARPELSESEVAKRLVAADRALNAARLGEARAIYRDLLATGSLARPNLLRVAEGLYRARDFAPALQAFRRLGTLSRSEEPYRYYIAVALYETGDYARAKDELRAALPFIEVTPDVARYQAKIDGAVR